MLNPHPHSAPFSMPPLGPTYTAQVVERCEDLIHHNIWGGLTIPRLRGWYANFHDPLEKYFAARLLDSLIYRSRHQTTAVAIQLLQRALPQSIRSSPRPSAPSDDWLLALRAKTDPGIRIVPVLRDSDPPTKSGLTICRLLTKQLGISEDLMIWPWQIQDQLKRGIIEFLLVDDFVGTGKQFIKFYKRFSIGTLSRQASFTYAPLSAHHKGLKSIAKNVLPTVNTVAAELLTDEHSLFAPGTLHFRDGLNSPATARQFYLSFLHKYQLTPRDAFGYGQLAVSYGFEHATPNATLPLFWGRWNHFSPLLER